MINRGNATLVVQFGHQRGPLPSRKVNKEVAQPHPDWPGDPGRNSRNCPCTMASLNWPRGPIPQKSPMCLHHTRPEGEYQWAKSFPPIPLREPGLSPDRDSVAGRLTPQTPACGPIRSSDTAVRVLPRTPPRGRPFPPRPRVLTTDTELPRAGHFAETTPE